MRVGRKAAAAATLAGAIMGFMGLGSFARQPAIPTPEGVCARFDIEKSTAFNTAAKPIAYPWRRDLPRDLGPDTPHAWDSIDATQDWEGYMAAVLSEVKASGINLTGGKASMTPDAEWWIAPWMDYGDNGREKLLGLTKERNPGKGDLSPTSGVGRQVWAVGFYNREGAHALGQVFADPCNPQVPVSGWSMPAGAASFKLLFTTATGADASYLTGSPEVRAFISDGAGRSEGSVRLLQMDIAVRDPRAPNGWVLGTYIWQGPAKGDGFLDNLVPVGLMWGNDPAAAASPRDAFATLTETKLNPALAGVVWRGHGQAWEERPWPGFQGRLNGPADNMISTCMSCHGLAQWPRSQRLNILPLAAAGYTMTTLNDADVRARLAADYLRNVPAGTLTDPTEATPTADWGGARPLDYSLQVEAALTRMCTACADGSMSGPTPDLCRVKGLSKKLYVEAATCPKSSFLKSLQERLTTDKPARQ